MRRVLIVDDDRTFRQLLRQVLAGSDEFEVVGEAGEAARGVSAAREVSPDLILLDVNLPDATGFDVVSQFGADTDVVMISSRDDADYERRAEQAGAVAFVSKHDLSPALISELLDPA